MLRRFHVFIGTYSSFSRTQWWVFVFVCLVSLIASVTAVMCSGSSSTKPIVGVVYGDYLGDGGEAMAPVAKRHLEGVTKALDAVRIPYVLTSDSALERDGVPDVNVLVLPYNRAVSEVELGHILQFIREGGRAVVCYLGRNDLLYAIGVDPIKPMLASDLQLAGADIVASAAANTVLGMPSRVQQPAKYIMSCRPLDGGRIVAEWSHGTALRMPAVISNGCGTFIACGLTDAHSPEVGQLLRAIIGTHAPSVWEQSIPSTPDALGPYHVYANLTDLAASVAAKAATGQDVSAASRSVREAVELLTQAKQLKARSQYADALAAAQKADALAREAVWQNYAHVEGEMRGVWTHYYVDPSWDAAIAKMKSANLNAVFPYVASGGVAFYGSAILPHHKSVSEHGDWLAEASEACARYNMPLHPRILGLSTLYASPETRESLKRQGRLVIDNNGQAGTWLCPTNPLNRKLLADTVREIASNYKVRGIQLDYMRYPWKNACFCEKCKAAFEKSSGTKVGKWPEDVYTGNRSEEFNDFRRAQLTTLVAELRAAAVDIAPDIEFSAAVFINWEDHRNTFAQDWKVWVDRGLVDFVCPMDYTADEARFRMYLQWQKGWVAGQVPIFAGIGLNADKYRFSKPEQLLRQIEIGREEGASGWVVFNYCNRFEEFLPYLSKGITAKPTEYVLPE